MFEVKLSKFADIELYFCLYIEALAKKFKGIRKSVNSSGWTIFELDHASGTFVVDEKYLRTKHFPSRFSLC